MSSINFSFKRPVGNCDIFKLISCDIFKSILFIPSFFSGLNISFFSFKDGVDDDSIINNFLFFVPVFLPTFLLFFLRRACSVEEEVVKSCEPLDDDSIISLCFF